MAAKMISTVVTDITDAKITRCTLYGVDVARIYAFSSSFFGVGTIPANTEIQVHSWLHTITMTAKAISLKTIMIASPPHLVERNGGPKTWLRQCDLPFMNL